MCFVGAFICMLQQAMWQHASGSSAFGDEVRYHSRTVSTFKLHLGHSEAPVTDAPKEASQPTAPLTALLLPFRQEDVLLAERIKEVFVKVDQHPTGQFKRNINVLLTFAENAS